MATEPDRRERILRIREDGVAWRRVGDDVVVLDIERTAYLGVNRTGAAIWMAMSSGATEQELISIVMKRFRVDRDRATRDVEAFVGDLLARGLAEEETAP